MQLATEVCGFLTIVGGTFLLHTTRDLDLTPLDLDRLTKSDRSSEDGAGTGGRAASGGLRGRRPAVQAMEMAGGGKHMALDVGGGGGGGSATDGGAAAAGDREDEPLIGSMTRKR